MGKGTDRIKLTYEQTDVVKCDVSPISLQGFYGTGKTGTLCSYIVERLRLDENALILGLSLTKLAAMNLKGKLVKHPDWDPIFERRVTVGTFHSFAYSYVRKFAGLVGFTSNFSIDNGINASFSIAEAWFRTEAMGLVGQKDRAAGFPARPEPVLEDAAPAAEPAPEAAPATEAAAETPKDLEP